jgi:FkbM family methyltransferase
MSFIGKLKRELVVFFSKTCVRSAQNDYLGLDLKYPIIYGMGRGYVIPKEIWMGQCLDAFIRSKQGCVIDVGVNVGVYLVKLKVLRGDIEYIGFEPNAVCNYYTNELIRMNEFKMARVLPVALSNELSVKTLYASKLGDKTASLVVETTNDNASLEYSSDTVTVEGDVFIEMLGIKEIAVIKVDVEGAELFVLNGLVKTIEKFRPFFYIEVWANKEKDAESMDRITQIYNLITSRDYSIISVNRNRKLGIVNSPDDIFEQDDPNYMFVPNELVESFKSNVGKIDNSDVTV